TRDATALATAGGDATVGRSWRSLLGVFGADLAGRHRFHGVDRGRGPRGEGARSGDGLVVAAAPRATGQGALLRIRQGVVPRTVPPLRACLRSVERLSSLSGSHPGKG